MSDGRDMLHDGVKYQVGALVEAVLVYFKNVEKYEDR